MGGKKEGAADSSFQTRIPSGLVSMSKMQVYEWLNRDIPGEFRCPENNDLIAVDDCESPCEGEGCCLLQSCGKYKEQKGGEKIGSQLPRIKNAVSPSHNDYENP